MYYIGVDLGGTNIKAAIVDGDCAILGEGSLPTALPRSADEVCADIAAAVRTALDEAGLTLEQMDGLGVGCPGTVNPQTGVVEYSNNLDWRGYPLRARLAGHLGLNAAMGNDANVAALGEYCAGSARGTKSAVVVTLGTGVGSGVVIDGEILTGSNFAASELGHMVIERNGRACTCGRHGCLEAYASATGLIASTREAAQTHPDSLLAKLAREGVTGRTAFDAAKAGDAAGQAVVDDYIDALACGVANIINIFQPEIVSLGGGVAKEGEGLFGPLRARVYPQVFGGENASSARIEACTLGYKAGLIGAAMLAAQANR